MSRYSHSGALTAGLILIVLGVIFLAESLYASFSAWQLFSKYWPLILIILGLRNLYLYFTWPETYSPSDTATSKE
jgi:ABC-type polysaccharide/polyol phosphate export permease